MSKEELIKSLEENKARDISIENGELTIISNYGDLRISIGADNNLYLQKDGKWKKVITEEVQ